MRSGLQSHLSPQRSQRSQPQPQESAEVSSTSCPGSTHGYCCFLLCCCCLCRSFHPNHRSHLLHFLLSAHPRSSSQESTDLQVPPVPHSPFFLFGSHHQYTDRSSSDSPAAPVVSHRKKVQFSVFQGTLLSSSFFLLYSHYFIVYNYILMIPGSKGQKSNANLLARGFLTPTSF